MVVGAMPPFWILILIPCINSATSKALEPTPDLRSDKIWALLEQTYGRGDVSSQEKPTPNAGSPLILTPYIEAKKLKEARDAARVNSTDLLPGIESYAGYLTVNKKYNGNLWFWYFPAPGKKVEDTPWIIWLQGGPGATSLYGLFAEIGPFFVTANNTLEERMYSWGKNHSLLFIDNPVGTGFSFADDENAYATNQTTIGENFYDALQQFLTIFPELREAPLTIAGESYAGKYIPSIGVQIYLHKCDGEPINLQGLAIGNGWIDPINMQRYSYFVREVGIVDDKVADQMKKLEAEVVSLIESKSMAHAMYIYGSILNLYATHSNVSSFYNILQNNKINLDKTWVDFVEQDKIRYALHVGNSTFKVSSGHVYYKLLHDFMDSVKLSLEVLLDHYKILLYNGHLDFIVAYHPSVNVYNSLSFSGASEFKKAKRLSWYHDGDVAGYYRIAGNLTEVMVRGAGHMVPIDKPAAALGLISAFIRGITLDKDTANLVG